MCGCVCVVVGEIVCVFGEVCMIGSGWLLILVLFVVAALLLFFIVNVACLVASAFRELYVCCKNLANKAKAPRQNHNCKYMFTFFVLFSQM